MASLPATLAAPLRQWFKLRAQGARWQRAGCIALGDLG